MRFIFSRAMMPHMSLHTSSPARDPGYIREQLRDGWRRYADGKDGVENGMAVVDMQYMIKSHYPFLNYKTDTIPGPITVSYSSPPRCTCARSSRQHHDVMHLQNLPSLELAVVRLKC